MNNYNTNISLRTSINKKCRERLYKTGVIMVIIVFVTEVLIFFYNKFFDDLFLTEHTYLIRFLIIPTAANILALFIALIRLKSSRITESEKNFAISLLMFAICAVTEICHYVYQPILCAPCVAIFITIIFADKKITRTISILSFVSLVISITIAAFDLKKGHNQFYIDGIVASIIIFFSYFSACVLIEYQKEMNEGINSSNKRQNELIEEMKVDALTGLFNKKALSESIEAKVKNYSYGKKQLHMAIIDIDHFKKVNDTYGHAMGDVVLVELSALIKAIVKGKASAFRFGGEEFVILFEKQISSEAYAIAEEIRIMFEIHKFNFMGDNNITLSCGISEYKGKEWSSNDWFEKADEMLYQAKESGRNQTVVYDPNKITV